jgi:hypothetical protein
MMRWKPAIKRLLEWWSVPIVAAIILLLIEYIEHLLGWT